MARAIDKRIMLDLIIEAKKTDPEAGPFSEWLAEYLVNHLPTLTPPNEWARVKERLPEKKQDVLMLFNAGNMAVGWLNDTDWCAYTDDGFYTDCDSAPIYWMPLPKPPKGTEDVAENATTTEHSAWHEWIKERFDAVR